MKKIHLGFQQRGKWHEIVEFGEKIYMAAKRSITESDDYSESEKKRLLEYLEEFEEWRPKALEDSPELSDKTAESASINSPEAQDVKDNMSEAGKNLQESMGAVEDNDPRKAGEHWKESTKQLVLASGGQLKRIITWLEKTVYKNLMTVVSPYYFDNDLLSASIWKKQDNGFVFEVNINQDLIRESFSIEIEEAEEQSRWHAEHEEEVETEAHTKAEAIDNVKDTRSKEQQTSGLKPN